MHGNWHSGEIVSTGNQRCLTNYLNVLTPATGAHANTYMDSRDLLANTSLGRIVS